VTTTALAVLLADDKGKGSPIGLFVVLALCVVVYLLYRSMAKHLRKVPDSFDSATPEADPQDGSEGHGSPPA
jgi:hypothetical protein